MKIHQIKLPLIAIGTALLFSSCATRYATLPPEAGVSPNPDALLKTMSTRLASTKQYRFTATRTMPKDVAEKSHQPPKADVEVLLARPNKLAARLTAKEARREMIYDGRTFTVVDGLNHFYSTAPLPGSLDTIPAALAKIYGFQPPLAEFILSDPYRDIRHRTEKVSYLGKGTVREDGKTVLCHRIGLHGKLADSELWLGVDDSLPRRLKASGKDTAGSNLLVDFDFLTWDLNPQVSASAFRYQPSAGTEKIPMISLAEANAARH